jgi:hypothetical protein
VHVVGLIEGAPIHLDAEVRAGGEKVKRVLTPKSSRRMAPASKAMTANAMVSGKRSSCAVVMPDRMRQARDQAIIEYRFGRREYAEERQEGA